jgi:hypothetical protein
MSFENKECVCGYKKPCETMLCDKCFTHLSETAEMRTFLDKTYSYESRRSAAIKLLSMARKHTNKLPLHFIQ